MKLWTIQLARWRAAKLQNIPVENITVAAEHPIFSPSWEMVLNHKHQLLSDEAYSDKYTELMRKSLREHHDAWIDFCRRDKVAIGCYCPPNVFCHRLLLIRMLDRICLHYDIPFKYMGEL